MSLADFFRTERRIARVKGADHAWTFRVTLPDEVGDGWPIVLEA
jgi:hypothetical protein